ncbi:DUF2189 domain-containing protein [Sphingomonas sp. DT-204]|uniref:DUF2189 domain-containing protein n=1 Tax=Sphingomonas sp. DT-204 TaxID=3396166 RepID=UPI003F1D1957
MAFAHVEGVDRPAPAPQVRTITTADLRAALREGWADFMDRRGDLIFVGIIYPMVGVLAAIVALRGSLIHLLFPLAAGISLLGPAAALGFYELARRREQGLAADWSHFLDVTKRPAFDSIAVVTGVLLAIFGAWLTVAATLYFGLMGAVPDSMGAFANRLFTTPEGWALIVAGNLFGAVFAAAVLTVSVVSMPMLVDKDVDARTAVDTSVRAVVANKGVMIRWGLIVAALLIAGSIPFFVGLAVVLPVLGYATWHLYTRLVAR